ncbi:MAG: GNAT family N-acetyltransferase [Flavobacteriaceae bacterium]|nr:MAG: GNAT family N-acetyltransferase [Flavobacteriaceae bacterium]
MSKHLSVRRMTRADVPYIVNYWQNASKEQLLKMGALIEKVPSEKVMTSFLESQILLPDVKKESFCTIWLLEGTPVGHCNVNTILYGKQANMHLHVWKPLERNKGYGVQFVKKSLIYFFKDLNLQNVICEPYAFNKAPNKTLEKVGFSFQKEYTTIPGSLNFEQVVKLWSLSNDDFRQRIL